MGFNMWKTKLTKDILNKRKMPESHAAKYCLLVSGDDMWKWKEILLIFTSQELTGPSVQTAPPTSE